MAVKNFGILTSIDWNSNGWKEQATEEDSTHSSLGVVADNSLSHSSLNFAHEIHPANEKGYYFGMLPQMWAKMPDKEKARNVEVVFIKAQNWSDEQSYIVGFYAFPVFEKCRQASPIPEITTEFELNIKALPKDIHLLETPVNLSASPDLQKILPKGKGLGKQGFNFLTRENVFKILDKMTEANPTDKKLSGIKYRLIITIERQK